MTRARRGSRSIGASEAPATSQATKITTTISARTATFAAALVATTALAVLR